MVNLITEHMAIWTAAQIQKSNGGRGRRKNSNGQSLYGIKKLRELILELGVRGRLVPQDPSDEPASALMEKIAKEKRRLFKEGKIKKQKLFPEITEDEKFFELPVGWVWARIADIGHDWGQKKPDTDFTYIEVSAIDNVIGIVKYPNILNAAKAPSRARKIVKVGTVIYSTVRPYLQNICVIDQAYSPEPIASTAFAVLHPFQQMPGKFFVQYLRSPVFVNYVESAQTGIAYPAINDKQFLSGLVPIPPLAEQHRIVAKVDELMALCDKLEQQQTDSSATHQTLVETLLATLTNASDQRELAKTWQRIANHFDTLFITEQSIDHLKQTILQLAVMGKLVPQDPNDEPASVLLKKIAKEKERLIKEGKIKKQKPLLGICEDEKSVELPAGWAWARLTDCYDVRDGTHDSPKYQTDGFPLVTSKNLSSGKLDLLNVNYISKEEHLKIIERSRVNKGDILFAMIGSIGNPVIVDTNDEFSIKNVALFKYYDVKLAAPSYLKIFLELAAVMMKEKAAGGVQPFVSLGKLRAHVLALPPLAEQNRIVTKVDELMELCDQLKSRLNEAQSIQNQLADTIIKQAVA